MRLFGVYLEWRKPPPLTLLSRQRQAQTVQNCALRTPRLWSDLDNPFRSWTYTAHAVRCAIRYDPVVDVCTRICRVNTMHYCHGYTLEDTVSSMVCAVACMAGGNISSILFTNFRLAAHCRPWSIASTDIPSLFLQV